MVLKIKPTISSTIVTWSFDFSNLGILSLSTSVDWRVHVKWGVFGPGVGPWTSGDGVMDQDYAHGVKGAPADSLFAQFCLHSLQLGGCNIRGMCWSISKLLVCWFWLWLFFFPCVDVVPRIWSPILDKPEPGCMASLNLKMTLCVVILCSIFLKAVTNCMNLLKHILLMSNVMSKWMTCVKQSSTTWACSNCSAVDWVCAGGSVVLGWGSHTSPYVTQCTTRLVYMLTAPKTAIGA